LHELVQSAHFGHQIGAGAQVEMIGIREHQAGADFLQLGGGHRFNGCLGTHRREDGRGNVAMWGVKYAGAGISVAGEQVVLKGFR
jgi:hypothetical protein